MLTITILKEISYILLRLPFGVANGPNDYSLISEPLFDLTNDILLDSTLNPIEVNTPLQNEMSEKANYKGEDKQLGKALPLFVEVPFHYAKADEYIDDIITVVLDKEDKASKAQKATPLATHTLFRPTDKRDPT